MNTATTAHRVDLDQLGHQLAELTGQVGVELSRATNALLSADLELASRVIGDENTLKKPHLRIDAHALRLLTDAHLDPAEARRTVAYLRISADLERMATIAENIADMAVERHPLPIVAAELRHLLNRMGHAGWQASARAKAVLRSAGTELAVAMERDHEMTTLRESLEHHLLDCVDPRTVMDLARAGRGFEAYAALAVSVATKAALLGIG